MIRVSEGETCNTTCWLLCLIILSNNSVKRGCLLSFSLPSSSLSLSLSFTPSVCLWFGFCLHPNNEWKCAIPGSCSSAQNVLLSVILHRIINVFLKPYLDRISVTRGGGVMPLLPEHLWDFRPIRNLGLRYRLHMFASGKITVSLHSV